MLLLCCVQVARLCQYMGDYHTNNQAEYAGLIAGLQVREAVIFFQGDQAAEEEYCCVALACWWLQQLGSGPAVAVCPAPAQLHAFP